MCVGLRKTAAVIFWFDVETERLLELGAYRLVIHFSCHCEEARSMIQGALIHIYQMHPVKLRAQRLYELH